MLQASVVENFINTARFIIQVAVPVPLRQLFSYLYQVPLSAGERVLVPFGKRKLVGIVINSQEAEHTGEVDSLKSIEQRLDEQALVDAHLLLLAHWLADYYHFPLGETLATMLPAWLRKPNTHHALQQLLAQKYFELTEEGCAAWANGTIKHATQRTIFEQLHNGPLSTKQLKQQCSLASINTLQKNGLLKQTTKLAAKGTSWQHSLDIGDKPTVNTEQGVAIGSLTARLQRFSISLLQGVTGSGKTEVYLQLIEEVLLSGRQALVLIPEIGLTPQTVARFQTRFNCTVGVLNSSVSDKQRAQIWLQASYGLLPIIIGTRSAIFTPFYNLGIIVIDEEHDDALKQQDGLRYHARDVAAIRAQRLAIPLLIGSATPSLETLNNALTGRYHHLVLNQRAGAAQTVTQHILDIRHQSLYGGLAEAVIEQIRVHLNQGNQVLLFLNRRGYAPVIMCHSCGAIELCHSCDKPMTWHKQSRRLICHHCDVQRVVPKRCSHCHAVDIVSDGVGTEQLESVVNELFPNHHAVRIDRDNTRKKAAFESAYVDIHSGKADILIGTQMLAKGHHFPNVTLVVIVDVDGGLFSVDTRAQEKLTQLITQISGRAGRANKKGQMILQTHRPDHPLLQDLVNNGYSHVARLLLAERKALNAPPFYAQAIIRTESKDANVCQQVLSTAKQALVYPENVVCIGPLPALFEKRANRYRFILILRASVRKSLHQALHHITTVLDTDKSAKKCRWAVDVDAIDLS